MSYPKVTILFSDGNLLRNVDAIDGIAGLIGTVETPGLIGRTFQVFNLADAEDKGFTLADEPAYHRQLKEFYAEVAGNQELWLMGVEDTMAMATMLDKDADDSAKVLLAAAQGKIRLLGAFRKPDGAYDPGNDFFDADVDAALVKANTFVADQHTKYNYLRVLIEGRVANEDSTDVTDIKTLENDYAGVVVGGSVNDGSASIGTALGRAVRYGAHVKLGKVANGPLQLTTAYIGTKPIAEYLALETLHGKGVISFMNHPTKAGLYFGIDRMANTGDYRLLAHGRVIDKAAVIAVATYVNELESEITIVNGKISDTDLIHLEGRIKQQINNAMADQISGLEVYINPSQDVINTSKVTVKLRIQPLGYTSFIDVDLGLTA